MLLPNQKYVLFVTEKTALLVMDGIKEKPLVVLNLSVMRFL